MVLSICIPQYGGNVTGQPIANNIHVIGIRRLTCRVSLQNITFYRRLIFGNNGV